MELSPIQDFIFRDSALMLNNKSSVKLSDTNLARKAIFGFIHLRWGPETIDPDVDDPGSAEWLEDVVSLVIRMKKEFEIENMTEVWDDPSNWHKNCVDEVAQNGTVSKFFLLE